MKSFVFSSNAPIATPDSKSENAILAVPRETNKRRRPQLKFQMQCVMLLIMQNVVYMLLAFVIGSFRVRHIPQKASLRNCDLARLRLLHCGRGLASMCLCTGNLEPSGRFDFLQRTCVVRAPCT